MINIVDDFFNTEDFAETATYINPLDVSSSITVIFNAPFHVEAVGNIEYMSKDPSVVCRTTDVADADTSAQIIYNGATYYVAEVQHDGTGITTLILSKN